MPLNIRKILLPVDTPEALGIASRRLVQQAAWMARRFRAEIILMHAVPPFSYPAGWIESGDEITARDLHSRVIQRAQQRLDGMLHAELEGIPVTRLLLRGEPAHEIVEAADAHKADLIMMTTDGEGAFYRFLLGSVTAKVLHETSCPVWTGAHVDEALPHAAPAADFSISHVLCSVDLSGHSRYTLAVAAELASSAGAMLSLVYVTAGTEMWGPGGTQTDTPWKDKLTAYAAGEIAAIQLAAGTHANVIIESGSVPETLDRVAREARADILVLGHAPGRSHLGDNGEGYGIIRASHVPVLSV